MNRKFLKSIIATLVIMCIGYLVYLLNINNYSSRYNVKYVQDEGVNNINKDKIVYEQLKDGEVDRINTYEIVEPSNPVDEAKAILKLLGMSEVAVEKMVDDGELITVNEGGKILKLYKNTGGFMYYDINLANGKNKIDLDKINTNELVAKANGLLAEMKSENLKFEGIFPNQITKTDENNNPIEYSLLNVKFTRYLDGKKVLGFDKVSFDFDSEGNLCSAIVSVRDYKKVETVKINSPRKAFENFKNSGNGYIGTDDTSSNSGEINDSVLCYWIENPNKKELTKPIYSLSGHTINESSENKEGSKLNIRIDAIK